MKKISILLFALIAYANIYASESNENDREKILTAKYNERRDAYVSQASNINRDQALQTMCKHITASMDKSQSHAIDLHDLNNFKGLVRLISAPIWLPVLGYIGFTQLRNFFSSPKLRTLLSLGIVPSTMGLMYMGDKWLEKKEEDASMKFRRKEAEAALCSTLSWRLRYPELANKQKATGSSDN